MGKLKIGAKKMLKGMLLALAALIAFYVAVGFLAGERGYFRYRKLEDERFRLESEIAALRSENERLAEEVDLLKNDPEYIESLARKQGLVKTGEIIYQYEDGAKEDR